MITTSQILYEGRLNLVMLFTGISDGSDQETLSVKVRAADLNPPPKSLKIMNIYHGVTNGTIKLMWGNNSYDPVPFLTASFPDSVDFKNIGGMVAGAGSEASGNILLSTQGFDVGSSYSIKLEMRKKY